MTIVIHNAVIATVDDKDSLHYGAAIAVDGDRISAIGPSAEILAQHPGAEKVDGTGRMVMPGFANVHTHFTMTLARGVFEDLSPPHKPPFSGGLSPIPLPDMTPDERRAMALLGALEALRSGTTLVLEDTNDVDDYAEALAGTGLRFLLSERAYDRVGTSIGDPAPFKLDRALGQRHLRTIEAAHKKWNGKAQGRIRIAASAWAPDMCSPELLKDLRALQQQLDTWATIHCNQIWGEVAAVKAHRNRLPTEYLADLGFLHDRLVCAHCRCMEPSEEKLLGEAGVTVAFNAAIAARRGLSPRIADLEDYGCTIAMGSDNMAEDMVEVMRTGLFMERIRREDGRNPTPEQALRWATRNGYRALGMPDGGWLKAGNKADLIMVDLTRAHMVPVLRALSTFVHQAQARDVEAVMVDGQWLMKEGKVLCVDEEAVLAEAQQVANTAWPRLFAKRRDLKVPDGFSPDALPWSHCAATNHCHPERSEGPFLLPKGPSLRSG